MTIQQRSRLPITICAGASALAVALGAVLVAPAAAQADPIGGLVCGLLCPPASTSSPSPSPSTAPSPSTSASGTSSTSSPSPTPTSTPIASTGTVVVDVPPIVVGPIVIGGSGTPSTTPTSLPTTAPTTPTMPTVPTTIPDGSTPPTGSTQTASTPAASTPAATPPATSTPSTTAPEVGALRSVLASADVTTVYPVKDGYRDSVAFDLKGVTSTGRAIPVTGKAVLTKDGKTVTTWTLRSSTQRLVWNGRFGKAVKAGAYVLTVSMRDASGAASTATTRVQVSGQRLVAAATTVKSVASTGTHAMAVAPRKGLEKATVFLQVTTTATGMKGTQKLVFSKSGKKIVVPVRNGTHTSKPIAVPKALTSFRLTHTWKTGKLLSATYTYKYKVLK